MYPPDFVCTRARFVCLNVLWSREYFEIFGQGVSGDEAGWFAGIVLQIP